MPGAFGGGDGGSAAMDAAQIQANSAERAAQLQYQMYQEAAKREQPWVTVGGGGTASDWGNVGGALGQLAGLYNIPGSTKVDPTATLQATPGYQWLLNQGTTASDLSAASKGLSMSGAQQKGLTNWGQNLAQTYAWNPYINQLNTLSQSGQSGAALQGQQGMNAGQTMGNYYTQAGQALGQGVYNQYLANNASNQGWGSLLGMGLGLLAAPFTGGSSLLGTAASGLGGWLSGLAGGGSTPSYNATGWGGGAYSNW